MIRARRQRLRIAGVRAASLARQHSAEFGHQRPAGQHQIDTGVGQRVGELGMQAAGGPLKEQQIQLHDLVLVIINPTRDLRSVFGLLLLAVGCDIAWRFWAARK